ncbi:piezo-type mechanosensitive ion channel component 1-like [Nannospalax galili]|uniref:piezo-type mechanosensitive ion channel component 1-like n=1 Tax=Nannospalax galili TaxID=1026970 RepID=UPI00111C20F8|nr:piezo-type mechanosensitive ion channel component 1-like [Nannospalax galili]
MVSCFGAGHLICLYCYQTPFVQTALPPDTIWARVFGLKDFVSYTNCSNMLVLNTRHDWPVYVSPGILLLLYYTATSLLKLRKRCPSDQRKEAPREDEEHEHELELDQLELDSQAGDATQHMIPTSTAPDIDDCIVHDLTSQSPVRQRPSKSRAF